MGRRKLLLGGVAAAVVAVVAGLLAVRHLHTAAPTDCDTVRSMLDYNADFSAQTKESAKTNNPELSTGEQYRRWADQIKAYAAQISDPALAATAYTAAGLAARTADLVPKYRAKPDDVGVAREYARIGIEYGNAITMLDFSCSPGAAPAS